MAVLNRQMFRQPFPVVHRQEGTPLEGEVQDKKGILQSIKDSSIIKKIN